MEIMIWLVKKLPNLGDGVSPSDAVTRKQLDSSGFGDIGIGNHMISSAIWNK